MTLENKLSPPKECAPYICDNPPYLHISLMRQAGIDDDSNNDLNNSLPEQGRACFERDGFIVFQNVLDKESVDALNNRLEGVLRGVYDRGVAPDKIPRVSFQPPKKTHKKKRRKPKELDSTKMDHSEQSAGLEQSAVEDEVLGSTNEWNAEGMGPLGFVKGRRQEKTRVLQIINVHKSDRLFRELVTAESLGRVVSELTGWPHGARLAQDQVWAKYVRPPGASPLVFHRDSPYFMFTPDDVVTVWIALDQMDSELGPLQYIKGSHKWGDGRIGTSSSFFQSDGGTNLLRSAAEREGILLEELESVTMSGLEAGGISIHNGRTWHGSGKNESSHRPRRGIGLHFVPANARFTSESKKSRLWKTYVGDEEDISSMDLSEEDFPITWKVPN
eukprot:scaffold33916_cov51-Attheya_sp.AAC.4